MIGENDGAGNTWPSSPISDRPAPMPSSAVAIGSPMASSEPKAISRMTAAAATPTPSVGPPYGVSSRSTTSPPRLNVTPCPEAAVASFISDVASPLEMLAPAMSNCTVENAMCPSRDICPGVVYGSLTAVTCAARSNGMRALVTCALTAGAVIGLADLTARVSVSPAARGKCWLSTA